MPEIAWKRRRNGLGEARKRSEAVWEQRRNGLEAPKRPETVWDVWERFRNGFGMASECLGEARKHSETVWETRRNGLGEAPQRSQTAWKRLRNTQMREYEKRSWKYSKTHRNRPRNGLGEAQKRPESQNTLGEASGLEKMPRIGLRGSNAQERSERTSKAMVWKRLEIIQVQKRSGRGTTPRSGLGKLGKKQTKGTAKNFATMGCANKHIFRMSWWRGGDSQRA